jgi:hypothetical protein
MANRSYLYSRHTGDDVEFRDIAEWNYELPPALLILVGANPVTCKSAIWTVEEKIAIEGDANISRPLFLKLLDWLEPQLDAGFANAAKEARELLTRADRQGDKFHLEIGELYELEGLELPEMQTTTETNAAIAEELLLDVKRVLDSEQSAIESFEHERLRAIDNWEEQFGLYFSHVLYFNLGG